MRPGFHLCLAVIALALSFCHLQAGGFASDFNSGPPARAKIYGDALVEDVKGPQGGVLKLTTARRGQLGSFVVDPFDSKPISSFVVHFKAYIGGGSGADGFSFHFSPGLPAAPFADMASAGITAVFDTYENGDEIAPSIRIYFKRKMISSRLVPDLRAQRFADVMIKLDPDGTFDLSYDHELIFDNLQLGITNLAGRFAFGARTGDVTDNHFIDDLKIVTSVAPRVFVDTFSPIGTNNSSSPLIEIVLHDFKTRVNTNSIQLQLDNTPVTPMIAPQAPDINVVQYEPDHLLPPGSEHVMHLTFSDTGSPPATNSFSYSFKISSQIQQSK